MSKAKKSKRFRYQLETLLKVRNIRERQAQEAFQAAERAYLEAVEKEKKIKAYEQEKYLELRDLMSGKTAVTDVQMVLIRKAHLDRVHEDVLQHEAATKEAEHLKEAKRDALIAAVKNRKIIEKDRSKTREAWRKIMDKEDGKFLDDIAVIGHDTKRRAEQKPTDVSAARLTNGVEPRSNNEI